jgi:hypothetical protein
MEQLQLLGFSFSRRLYPDIPGAITWIMDPVRAIPEAEGHVNFGFITVNIIGTENPLNCTAMINKMTALLPNMYNNVSRLWQSFFVHTLLTLD